MRPLFFALVAAFTAFTSPAAQASEFADPQLNELAKMGPMDFGKRGPIVKSCSLKMQLDPKMTPVFLNMFVVAIDGSVQAIVSERVNGERTSRMTTAEAEYSTIRPGLTAQTNPDDATLNGGERLIVHAMSLASEPSVGSMFQSGLDLKKVRVTKVFYIERRPQDIGSAAIIEALDENGKVLGTFMGGFLVARCK